MLGDPAGRADIERALELQIEAGDDAGLAAALWLGGAVAIFGEDSRLARRAARTLRGVVARRSACRPSRPAPASCSAWLAWSSVTWRGARAALAKGVPAVVDLGDRFAIPIGLSALAGLAAEEGRPRAALRLAGAAAAYEEVNQTYRPQKIRAELDAWLAPVRATVGAAAAKLFDEGRGLTLDQAVALGLDDAPRGPMAGRAVGGPDPAGAGDRGAGGHRADQPGDRREAVPVGAHRRGARRSRPDQARVPHAHPAGGVDARGRSGAANYVVAT